MSWKTNKRRRRRRSPILRFSPYAWAKLLFLRDRGPTEVGGFGIASPEDLLLVKTLPLSGKRRRHGRSASTMLRSPISSIGMWTKD